VLMRVDNIALDGMTAPAVNGQLTLKAVLNQLLSNTGLKYELVGEKVVRIAPADSGEAPTVSANYGGELRLTQADSENGGSSSAAPAERAGQDQQLPDAQGIHLEEILVTAQKRVERLQDVPVPVTAISGALLTRDHQLRIEDYYKRIPGLAMSLSGEGNAPAVSIRGITTGSDANATVGTVIDDIPYGGSVVPGTGLGVTAADIDPGDLKRLEVLRGPQGTLYGASSMGGLLKYVTVDPSTEQLTARVQLGATTVQKSSDVGHSVRANLNVPLSDTFAVRASAFTLEDPGFIDNIETGERNVNSRESEGARLSALWRPAETFSVKLSALHQDSIRNGTNEVDTALGSALQQRSLAGTGIYDRTTDAYSATIVATLGSVVLTSATGYSVDELVSKLDYTYSLPFLIPSQAQGFFGPGVNRLFSEQSSTVKKFSQELRAALSLGARVSWLFGAFYTEEKGDFSGRNVAGLDTGEAVGSPFALTYDSTFEERALFSTVTVDLTDRLDVQLGGRYSEHEQVSPITWTGPLAGLLFGADPFFATNLVADDDALTYLFTPRFRVSPDLMVYARLASGYRAGGPNNGCGAAPTLPCNFAPDGTQNFDVGAKGSVLDGTLSFDASVYYIDWRDIQIGSLFAFTPAGVFSYTDNASRARSRGAELSVEVKPGQTGLTISGWVSYNEAELRAALPNLLFTPVGRPGDRLPYAPRFSTSIALDHELPLRGSLSAFWGGTLSYVGERLGSFKFEGVERERMASYATLDLNAGLTYDTWELGLFINNALDKRTALRAGNESQFATTYVVYNQPRTIGLTLSKEF
jgi:iron complex outermembrane recepter protein